MSDAKLTYRAVDEAGTERLGQALAAALADGSLIALSGALGAGKTRLVQATAAACGVDRREVVSPTFVLIHEYVGRRSIIHIDVYRLPGAQEFLQLGIDEYLAPPNLVFIEWADRVSECLPQERLQISIAQLEDNSRQFEIVGRGPAYSQTVERLRSELETARRSTE